MNIVIYEKWIQHFIVLCYYYSGLMMMYRSLMKEPDEQLFYVLLRTDPKDTGRENIKLMGVRVNMWQSGANVGVTSKERI